MVQNEELFWASNENTSSYGKKVSLFKALFQKMVDCFKRL